MIAGLYIAAADFNGDGYADIIAGPSVGSSNLRIVSGSALTTGQGVVTLASMFAWPPNGSGVQMAVSDASGTGTPDLIVSSTNADNGRIGVLTPTALLSNNPGAIHWLDPLPGDPMNVFVG
jgi:hypothetical protein